jgi:hypothetical protein
MLWLAPTNLVVFQGAPHNMELLLMAAGARLLDVAGSGEVVADDVLDGVDGGRDTTSHSCNSTSNDT